MKSPEKCSKKTGGMCQPSRLLEIYEAVVMHGPISLDALYPTTTRSRSATFRALKQLKDCGWVRTLLNKRDYVATSKVDMLISSGTVTLPDMDYVTGLLHRCALEYPVHFDIGMYITSRSFWRLESTAVGFSREKELDVETSGLAMVAFSRLTKSSQVAILRNKQGLSLNSDRMKTFRIKCDRVTDDLSAHGHTLSETDKKVYIGFILQSKSVGAISISPKKEHFGDLKIIKDCAQKVQEHLENVVA